MMAVGARTYPILILGVNYTFPPIAIPTYVLFEDNLAITGADLPIILKENVIIVIFGAIIDGCRYHNIPNIDPRCELHHSLLLPSQVLD